MATKKVKLTTAERRLEEEVLRGEWKPVPPQEEAAFRAALHKKVAEIKRGGRRPGSGRKRKPAGLQRVQLSCRVKQATLRKLQARVMRLQKSSTRPASVGAIIDQLTEKL